jgi:hypothetical protein
MAEKQSLKIGQGKPGPGRPKGVPNKVTTALKDVILAAAHAQEGGAVGYLTRQAEENPVAFMGLLGRVLPLQVAGDPDAPLIVQTIRRVIHDPQA